MVIFAHHLQHVLDALPLGGQLPGTDNFTAHIVSDKVQKFNIPAVFVYPGLSRSDTITPLFKVRGKSIHVRHCFVPLPPPSYKINDICLSRAMLATADAPEEVLKAGTLYSVR